MSNLKPPSALDRISVRRTLMYIQKKLHQLYRCDLGEEWMQKETIEQLFWLNESGAIWDYDVAIGEHSALVAVQPRQHDEWIYIELERTITECTSMSV